ANGLKLRLAAPRHRPLHIASNTMRRQHVLRHETPGKSRRAIDDNVEFPLPRHAHLPCQPASQPSGDCRAASRSRSITPSQIAPAAPAFPPAALHAHSPLMDFLKPTVIAIPFFLV